MADPLLSPTERRERTRTYTDAFPPLGIYAIRNTATGQVWVGASRNVDGMLNRIRFELRMRGHRDASLAQAWARDGSDRARPRQLVHRGTHGSSGESSRRARLTASCAAPMSRF